MKKLGTRKLIAAGVACVCVAALLLTGTYAWFAVEKATNVFSGLYKDVMLHDDYEQVINTTGVINKDIYVENTGSVPVYVRIKLQEYLDLTSSDTPDFDAVNWDTHIPDAAERYHPLFTWALGGNKNYLPGVANEVGVDDTALTRKPTLSATVITMAAYLALPDDNARAAFVGWVYDTDGYAYWSQKLNPDTATGLLLDAVTVSGELDGAAYFYAIHVVMEAIDGDDLPMWMAGAPSVKDGETVQAEASENAKKMLKSLAGILDVGDTIFMNGYTWNVLDVKDGKALLFAETYVATRYFHRPEGAHGTDVLYPTWRDSDIRAYLNGEFYNSFSADQQAKMIKTAVETETGRNNATIITTHDTIFLLSAAEVIRYYPVEADRVVAGAGEVNWWLRSSYASADTMAARVSYYNGAIGGSAVGGYTFGVRPAMWIDNTGV